MVKVTYISTMGYSTCRVRHVTPLTKYLIVVTLTLLHISHVDSYFEYCTKNSIVTVKASECPYGVLFSKPQEISNCMFPTSGEHKPNICSDDGDTETARKVQLVDVGTDDEDGSGSASYPTDTCKAVEDNLEDPSPDKCPYEYVRATSISEGSFDEFSAESTNSEAAGKTDVKNQTLRLFMYMQDLLVDENEDVPNLRLITLLEKSFDVLRTHCPTKYVSEDFIREIKRAFLFLLRESDLRHVKDISVNQYTKISSVLDKCLNGPHPPKPFYLDGVICRSKAKITNIVKTKSRTGGILMNSTHPYARDKLSFKWGRWDVPVDATWGVMDFTHGLCYGMFNLDVNSHHLYEQALERLFITELVYRWSKPPKLNHEYYWNHIFRSQINMTMQNLDACIQASYLDSPFLHRLFRPMYKQPVDTIVRKKRETDQTVYCFKSQDEKEETISKLKAKQCDQPGN